MSRNRQESSVRLGTSATPSAASSRLNRVIKGEPLPPTATSLTSSDHPAASVSRADPGADADDDIEFIGQGGTPLSSLGLPSTILSFLKSAKLLYTSDFVAAGIEVQEMPRFIGLVKEWLESEKDKKKEEKGNAKKQYETIVEAIKLERIFSSTSRNADAEGNIPISSFNLSPGIFRFLQLADVHTQEDFRKNNLKISEMRRLAELIEEWLAKPGGRKDKASAKQEYDGMMELIQMERIFQACKGKA